MEKTNILYLDIETAFKFYSNEVKRLFSEAIFEYLASANKDMGIDQKNELRKKADSLVHVSDKPGESIDLLVSELPVLKSLRIINYNMIYQVNGTRKSCYFPKQERKIPFFILTNTAAKEVSGIVKYSERLNPKQESLDKSIEDYFHIVGAFKKSKNLCLHSSCTSLIKNILFSESPYKNIDPDFRKNLMEFDYMSKAMKAGEGIVISEPNIYTRRGFHRPREERSFFGKKKS